MKILGIIPARYGSTRFPGKPLVVIDGKTMIRRVYEQAVKCPSLAGVTVATDDDTIYRHVLSWGGHAVMTGSHHGSGTERCMEALTILEKEDGACDGVINIQGDEPFIDPEEITQLAHCMEESGAGIATLVKKILSDQDLDNPNVVKVVTDREGFALLFSRSAIPYARGFPGTERLTAAVYLRHVGIYGYRTDTLRQIISLPSCQPELAESLEQLRWLWHGYRIATKLTEFESIAIDSPEDLLKITNTHGPPGV